MFNPIVNKFRLHWISVRACDELLSVDSLSSFARGFMNPGQYYNSDVDHPHFRLVRLGRRSLTGRRVGGAFLRPHKFWSTYMSQVADERYRGKWRGLAPMRIDFRVQSPTGSLRVHPDVFAKIISAHPVTHLTVFPKAYLCPVGWWVGVVAEVRGKFPFSSVPLLVRYLRDGPAFLSGGMPVDLSAVLLRIHDMIRMSLLDRTNWSFPRIVHPYVVCSPIDFEGQDAFAEFDKSDVPVLLRIVTDVPTGNENKCVVTQGPHSTYATIFNRGTVLLATTKGAGPKAPECALSYIKNWIALTEVMQRFHRYTTGTSDTAVRQMRTEVATTFETLTRKYAAAPHLQLIWEKHQGLQTMLQNGRVNVSNYIFNAPVSQSAIGDNATLIQRIDGTQLAAELSAIRTAMEPLATTEEQKTELVKIDAAAVQARSGNKAGAIEHLKNLSSWGWETLKELASSIVAETLKQLIMR